MADVPVPGDFAPRPKWRIERIIHHELHPWEPALTLREKAQKGGRAHARDRRINQLIAKIARERHAPKAPNL
jgi:hypothetical protein